METFYTAYTKQVQQNKHFFVKRFIDFPELKNVEPVLASFGMHTNFDIACKIAGVENEKIKLQLLEEIQVNSQHAKVIEMSNEIIAKRVAL